MDNGQPPEVKELPAPPTQQFVPATQTQILQARYELVFLIFQFAVSLAVLVGAFLIIVNYQEAQAVGGATAVSTLVVSYWFGVRRDLQSRGH